MEYFCNHCHKMIQGAPAMKPTPNINVCPECHKKMTIKGALASNRARQAKKQIQVNDQRLLDLRFQGEPPASQPQTSTGSISPHIQKECRWCKQTSWKLPEQRSTCDGCKLNLKWLQECIKKSGYPYQVVLTWEKQRKKEQAKIANINRRALALAEQRQQTLIPVALQPEAPPPNGKLSKAMMNYQLSALRKEMEQKHKKENEELLEKIQIMLLNAPNFNQR